MQLIPCLLNEANARLLKNTESDLTKVMAILLIKTVRLYHRAGIDYSMPLPDFLFLNHSKGVYHVPKYYSLVISNYWK